MYHKAFSLPRPKYIRIDRKFCFSTMIRTIFLHYQADMVLFNLLVSLSHLGSIADMALHILLSLI